MPLGSPVPASRSIRMESDGSGVPRPIPAAASAAELATECERQDMAPEPPDRTDIDRVVGRYAVKLPARREALFGEVGGHVPVIGRLADRHGDDPFARLRLGDQRRDPREHVVDRPAARERGENRLQPLAVEMRVPIDQARHDRSAAGVDAHGVRPDQRFDFGGAADGGNPVARHRDGIAIVPFRSTAIALPRVTARSAGAAIRRRPRRPRGGCRRRPSARRPRPPRSPWRNRNRPRRPRA